jgi:hypothetical protein
MHTLVYILVICVVVGLIWWVADYLPVPQPLNKMLKVISMIVAVIIIIYALLGFAGVAPPLPA